MTAVLYYYFTLLYQLYTTYLYITLTTIQKQKSAVTHNFVRKKNTILIRGNIQVNTLIV